MADAGIGKLRISAAFVDGFKSQPSQKWAYHFRKHDDHLNLVPSNNVKTLVAQLCSR